MTPTFTARIKKEKCPTAGCDDALRVFEPLALLIHLPASCFFGAVALRFQLKLAVYC